VGQGERRQGKGIAAIAEVVRRENPGLSSSASPARARRQARSATGLEVAAVRAQDQQAQATLAGKRAESFAQRLCSGGHREGRPAKRGAPGCFARMVRIG
jgi:hypothetical protein